jgi:hypothetical protein
MSKYQPNKYIKAMLILDRLDEFHPCIKTEILEALGYSEAEYEELIRWLTTKGSDVDLNKVSS